MILQSVRGDKLECGAFVYITLVGLGSYFVQVPKQTQNGSDERARSLPLLGQGRLVRLTAWLECCTALSPGRLPPGTPAQRHAAIAARMRAYTPCRVRRTLSHPCSAPARSQKGAACSFRHDPADFGMGFEPNASGATSGWIWKEGYGLVDAGGPGRGAPPPPSGGIPRGGAPIEGVDGNWRCSSCNNVNFFQRNECKRCQSAKPPPEILNERLQAIASQAQTPKVCGIDDRGAPVEGVNGNWKCLTCTNVNFAQRERCHRCGGPKIEDTTGQQFLDSNTGQVYVMTADGQLQLASEAQSQAVTSAPTQTQAGREGQGGYGEGQGDGYGGQSQGGGYGGQAQGGGYGGQSHGGGYGGQAQGGGYGGQSQGDGYGGQSQGGGYGGQSQGGGYGGQSQGGGYGGQSQGSGYGGQSQGGGYGGQAHSGGYGGQAQPTAEAGYAQAGVPDTGALNQRITTLEVRQTQLEAQLQVMQAQMQSTQLMLAQQAQLFVSGLGDTAAATAMAAGGIGAVGDAAPLLAGAEAAAADGQSAAADGEPVVGDKRKAEANSYDDSQAAAQLQMPRFG